MINILALASSFGGGVLVGGAYAAFITLVKVIPRLTQFTETYKYLKFYESIFTCSTILFTIIYFSNFSINIGKIGIIVSGLFYGIFLGIFSAALAETLNVIPVIAKKFKIKKQIIIVFISIVIGKVCGSLYYFIVLIGG